MSKTPIAHSKFTPPLGSTATSLIAVCDGDFFKAKLHYNDITPDLIREREVRAQSNIYMICKRPKVRLVPGSTTELNIHGGETLYTGLLDIQSSSGRQRVPFAFNPVEVLSAQVAQFDSSQMPEHIRSTISFEVGEAPHSTLKAIIDIYDDLTGKLVKPLKMELELDYLSTHFRWYVPALQDLEVLYIGQSFGQKYESTSEERLHQHEQRTAITALASRTEDFDVVGAYLNFQAFLGGRSPNSAVPIPMPKKNVIDLVEGSLINQFKPLYNTQCKDKFPRGPAMFQDVLDLGIKDMRIDIDSSHDPIRFFTANTKARFFRPVAHRFLPNGTSVDETIGALEVKPRSPSNGESQMHYAQEYSEFIAELHRQLEARVKPKSFLNVIGDRIRNLTRRDNDEVPNDDPRNVI